MTFRFRLACALLILIALAPLECQAADPPVFHAGGFADAELHMTSEHERDGLDVLGLDVFSTLQFNDAWSALAEGVAQRSWRNRTENYDVDLERLIVEYSRSDALRIEVGETQTGIIRWNEREHRSRFLQTPIDVPAIARRPQEDGAWPLRLAGVFASGRVPGSLGISWGAGAGAGPGHKRELTPLAEKDRSLAALLSLSMAPDAVPGLEIAVAGYAGNVRTNPGRLHERDVTLSASYVVSGYELRGEWARMNHRLTSLPFAYLTTGYYTLFSKRLTGVAERVRLYLLLDRLTVARGEAYLAEATSENAWASGVRYDLNRHVSLKGEYRAQRAVNGDRENVVGLQLGVSF